MERILVAVDEDPLAPQAIETAARLARPVGATVVVCHVMPEEVYEDAVERLSRQQAEQPFTYAQAEEQARGVAEDAAQRLGPLGVMYETKGLVGHPPREIVNLAKRLNADLIVLGFEKLSGLSRLRALGSVSREVMENAPCPVLVVPEPQPALDPETRSR